jgi:AraC-like DNA-binding protein
MRLGKLPPGASARAWPTWPPLLATRGPGAVSAAHAHHAMHVIVALDGELAYRAGARGPMQRAAGVITAPDVVHSIDAVGREILLVFFDPESAHGGALLAHVDDVRALDGAARDALLAISRDPMAIMTTGGDAWTARLLSLFAEPAPPPRSVHPRVRKLLRLLPTLPPDADTSLDALAARVGLSPGRLMHAFTASIGTPLRPYLTWLRLQRAAAAIASGAPLSDAAHGAGFADAAHMTRTFRRMFGVTPSSLRSP